MKTFFIEDITNKRILGRSPLTKEGLALFWTASGIELNAKASELWAEFDSDYSDFESWISIWIDGKQMSRLMIAKGISKVCIFRNMRNSASKAKNVCIYKESPAFADDKKSSLVLKSLSTDGDFMPVKKSKLRIEFIGDSITSGEGVMGANGSSDWISMFFGGTETYAFRLSKMLGAEPRMLSQSGWGVITGFDNNPLHNIPLYYDEVCGLLDGPDNIRLGAKAPNDFKAWQPNLIVVNLGTNDQGAFSHPAFTDDNGNVYKMRLDKNGLPDNDDALYFESGVTQFLYLLRKNNPKAKIIWCYGMIGHLLLVQIKRAISTYKKESGDSNVEFVLMPEIDSKKTAALHHPSQEQHQAAADLLYKHIVKKDK